jgi:hypothetical protein
MTHLSAYTVEFVEEYANTVGVPGTCFMDFKNAKTGMVESII